MLSGQTQPSAITGSGLGRASPPYARPLASGPPLRRRSVRCRSSSSPSSPRGAAPRLPAARAPSSLRRRSGRGTPSQRGIGANAGAAPRRAFSCAWRRLRARCRRTTRPSGSLGGTVQACLANAVGPMARATPLSQRGWRNSRGWSWNSAAALRLRQRVGARGRRVTAAAARGAATAAAGPVDLAERRAAAAAAERAALAQETALPGVDLGTGGAPAAGFSLLLPHFPLLQMRRGEARRRRGRTFSRRRSGRPPPSRWRPPHRHELYVDLSGPRGGGRLAASTWPSRPARAAASGHVPHDQGAWRQRSC